MTNFPQHLDKVEARICDRLITAALNHPSNLFLRVFDGEEWATDWTRDRAVIEPQIAATEHTRIYVMQVDENGSAHRLGSILLIHSNGEDLISDTSWNSKQAGAEQLIESLCAEANAENVNF